MIRYYIILLGLIFLFASCEKEIDLDLPEQKKLVVLSNFNPNDLFQLHLSTSIPTGSNDSPDYPEDATIQLFEDGEYVQDFIFQDFGLGSLPFYSINRKPKVNKRYSIIASLPGYPNAESNDIVPASAELEKPEPAVIAQRENNSYPGIFEYRIKKRLQVLSAEDTPEYFHLKASRDIIDYFVENTDTIIYGVYARDMRIDIPMMIPHLAIQHEEGILFSGKAFVDNPDGIELTFTFEHDTYRHLKGPIYIELRTVSEDYYRFHKSVGEQEVSRVSQSILSETAISIHNNIRGGLGNFSGYSMQLDSIRW